VGGLEGSDSSTECNVRFSCQKVVQNALDRAAKGRTTVSIAHRLSSIQHADVIYVLKDGLVAESGSHQELLEQKGLYFELVQQQDLPTIIS
jgi:ATP-binding cassette, subfamily B (MDR/TAP), member 1